MSMESDLMVLISQIYFLLSKYYEKKEEVVITKVTSLVIQTISLFNSTDLDSQPKPESKFISLVKQIISVSRAIKNSEPEWELISQMTSIISLVSSDPKQESQPELIPLVTKLFNDFKSSGLDSDGDSKPEWTLPTIFLTIIASLTSGKPPSELMIPRGLPYNFKTLDAYLDWDSESKLRPLISQIFRLAKFGSLSSLISLSPRVEVELEGEKFRVRSKVKGASEEKGDCDPHKLKVLNLTGEVPTHFHCQDCNCEYHEECEKAPLEVKHPLHPKHSLQLVLLEEESRTRECYCCDEDLRLVFYYCSACDCAMNIACVEKSPVSSIDHLKWHEHALVLFSRYTSLTCDVCALTDSACPFYICPPCGFVVHQKCIDLPRVIRISRHPHRISFTPSFNKGDWSCGVCRRKIDNDYGGYSCTKNDCSYAVHSRCATQRNVWDGVDLDGVPEEIEEEVLEPFVRISDGIIQHFSHQHHHLRLVEHTEKDYDESKQCQACITPIYFGNIYSCTQCDFILHEKCANLSRSLHNPIHPHMLTLVGGYDGVMDYFRDKCSACDLVCTGGFFYKCGEEECGHFKLHVQCATISEPLVHESHMHSLFLTSKPGEERECGICKKDRLETFNCIGECNFSLCFECATLPHQVRYKHDKHMLTLTYGEGTSTIEYWCEACEKKIDTTERFYKCNDGCCVTLHQGCLIGKDLYMKHNSSLFITGKEFDVLPNGHHMSRPICSFCTRRCPYNIVFHHSGSITCCIMCTFVTP